jgi:hypothetical protein
VWLGEGWLRTRRILGVTGLVVAYALEATIPSVDLPITVYSSIWGLLGLDVLLEATDRLKK